MDTDTDQTSETTEVSDKSAQESAPVVNDSTQSGDELSEGQTAVTAEYKPDYKLKVYDEEKELDDPFLKALIKDADSEKKVKEIAQKFLGFDTVKTRHEKTKTEYQEYQKSAEPIMEYYNVADKMLQKGDLESFFKLVNIPEQKIFEYAVRKAEEMALPQEQRQYMEQQKDIQRQRDYLESQNQTLQNQFQSQVSQFRNQELGWVLARPEVSGVAQSYDSKVGPGSFRQLVIQKGLAHAAATSGMEDLTAEQAVSEVLKMISPLVQQAGGTVATPAAAHGQSNLIPQNGAPPIIPNVSSKGSSPVKKQVRSVSDLKRVREEMASGRSS